MNCRYIQTFNAEWPSIFPISGCLTGMCMQEFENVLIDPSLLNDARFLFALLNYHIAAPVVFDEELKPGDMLTTFAGAPVGICWIHSYQSHVKFISQNSQTNW